MKVVVPNVKLYDKLSLLVGDIVKEKNRVES